MTAALPLKVVVSPMNSAFGAEGSEGSKGSKGSEGVDCPAGNAYKVSVMCLPSRPHSHSEPQAKNGRSTNQKESPLMGRLRADFGRLAHSIQNARSTRRA